MNKQLSTVKMVTPMLMFVFVSIALGQESTFESSLSTHVYTMFIDYFKPAVQICLFLWAAWEVIQGFIGRDKQTAWIQVIMIIAAIAILEVLPVVWNTIAQTNLGT